MPKILLVSPNFPPLIYPDLHRVRMLLPYLADYGWEATVLCLDPYQDAGVKDELLVQTIPSQTKVVIADQAPPLWQWLTGWLKGRTWRGVGSLAHRGDQLIEEDPPDLIYFSTTLFPVMALGPRWQKRYGIPYIVDWQDPWVSDYYSRTGVLPPGGKLKYAVSQILGKYLEAEVLRYASHIISVSPGYPPMLQARYPWLSHDRFTVLPFGGASYDFKLLPQLPVVNSIFDPNDGCKHWVYLGRFVEGMEYALSSLFTAIAQDRKLHEKSWARVRLHFVGTHYSVNSSHSPIMDLAQRYQLEDMVKEHPQRIPYFAALRTMTDSDVILVLGSDDQSYTSSKLYPCVLAQRSIFAVMHENSSVVEIIQQTNSGKVITFNYNRDGEALIREILANLPWLLEQSKQIMTNTNWEVFQEYTADYLTQKHIHIFNQMLQK
ncbi:MAG: glycosyltransferase [Pseudanabaenaceae cyanobacterium]|jgi:hypothetical protein